MAVIFPPWLDHDSAFRRVVAADGIPVRDGGFGWIIVAGSDDPAFAARAYRAGAWLVGNALIEAGCLAFDGSRPS